MRTSMTKMLSFITVMGIVIGMGLLASCQSNNSADLVVYGKIYTAEGNQIVEAFAVKEAFVEVGKTEVVDYSGKGLVMPGCGNGHAHYTLGYAIQSVGTVIGYEDSPEKFLKEIVPAAVKKAKDNGAKAIFGQGWNLMTFEHNMPTRQQPTRKAIRVWPTPSHWSMLAS